MDPDRRDDRHPVHGAAEAAGSDGGPDRRHHRHPHRLPHHPPAGPRLRPKSYGPAGGDDIFNALVRRRAVCLRLHRGRHPGLHGRIGRPHRGDVPPPGGDRTIAVGALPGPDTGRPGHRGAAGGHRVHRRLRGVRVRRTHPGQLPGPQRSRRAVPGRPRALGRGPRRRGGLQLPVSRDSTQHVVGNVLNGPVRWAGAAPEAVCDQQGGPPGHPHVHARARRRR